MILCTMPACQTTAGCQCDRKAYQASLDKINRATDREIDDAVRRVNYGGGTVSDIVERLRRRAEEMDALSDPPQDIRSMSWQVEAHAALAKAAKDNLASADRIEALERENAELRSELASARSQARREALEEAAMVAQDIWHHLMSAYIHMDGDNWLPGSPYDRGYQEAGKDAAAAIRRLAEQEGA